MSWNKLEFGHVGRKIAELQKKFQILELQSGSNINGEVDEVRRALDSWLDTEAAMWNTKFSYVFCWFLFQLMLMQLNLIMNSIFQIS